MERSFADFYERGRRQRAKSLFRKAGTWLWGALGLGALLGGYGTAVVNEVAPAPQVAQDLVCQVREWWADPAPGTQFTILISNLAGDGDGSQTARVREVFLGQRGLDVRSTCRVVTLDSSGRSLADAEAAALAEGRALLEGKNADLLVWGAVKKEDEELSLWFLSSGSSTLGVAPSYSLTEKVTLPENFRADLSVQLEAVALAQIAPATEQAGTYLVDLLTPVRAKLEQLLANPLPDLNDEQKADLRHSLALAAQTIGEQAGENEPLEAAVKAYREVLEVRTRERVPLDWAATQNNLGTALGTLGARADGTQRLEDAVAAYRAALEVRTRERVPLNWAMTQNNLSNVLRALGEREDGTQRLEEAVAACRAALEVWTRELFPLDWATAQNNLGLALWRLGGREDGSERLDQAATAFRAALAVYSEPLPLDWATIQSNLGNVLSMLGDREGDTQRLEQAVIAYDAALKVRTRKHVPLDWAKTQNNRGTALQMLGEREDGTSDAGVGRLEQAVAAQRAALEVFRLADAKYYVSGAERNLARAEALLAERRGKSAAE